MTNNAKTPDRPDDARDPHERRARATSPAAARPTSFPLFHPPGVVRLVTPAEEAALREGHA